MHIAILTFDAFNELDSLIALGILNRIKQPGWRVSIAAPSDYVRSMNGVVMQRHIDLSCVADADAVLIGSGMKTRELAADEQLVKALSLDPSRQLIGAQCSGALMLQALGLLEQQAVCSDMTTRPWLEELGVKVLNKPFHASGNLASAGGCLASQYLACWVIARLVGLEAASQALDYVAPVAEKRHYVERMRAVLEQDVLIPN